MNHPRSWLLCILVLSFWWCPSCLFKFPEAPESLFPGLEVIDGNDASTGEAVDLSVDDSQPGYQDWGWWIPDGGPDNAGSDWFPADFASPDSGDGEDPEFTWTCPYETTEFAPDIKSKSFVVTNQVLGENDYFMVYDWICGLGLTYTSQSPERGYPFVLDRPMSISAQLRCDDICLAYLVKNGCQYDNIDNCWYKNADQVKLTQDLMPALYMIGPEYLQQDMLESVNPDHLFDLHLAINNPYGQTPCLVEGTARHSEMSGTCDALDDLVLMTATDSGNLSWSDDDDLYLQCNHFGIEADDLGGMPDVVHSFIADFPGPGPRRVDVAVSFPAQEDSEVSHIVALTTAPCGAVEAVIDCTWGSDSMLVLEGIYVFPDETLFLVIDGAGADAFDSPSNTPYSITWTVYDSCL